MILTGPEISRRVQLQEITIDPFSSENLNPNSYNYRLGEQIIELGYDGRPHDVAPISKNGFLLKRGITYLATTLEVLGSGQFVTLLNGRSSMGRLGLFLNISADLGQLGPAHRWTLELNVVQPLIVYPRMIIGQATFWLPEGHIEHYTGEYASRSTPTPCLW